LIKDVGKKSNIVQRGFIYLIKSFEKLPAVKNSTMYDEGKKHDKSGFGSGAYAVSGGNLPLILISPAAKAGFVSTNEYTHYNLLATIEKMLNLGNLGKGDATAKPMMDLIG
jgi:Phosphoesterase family